MCNGFADECRPSSQVGEYKCDCQYDTQGLRCTECKPGFAQLNWRRRTATDKFKCESMNF